MNALRNVNLIHVWSNDFGHKHTMIPCSNTNEKELIVHAEHSPCVELLLK